MTLRMTFKTWEIKEYFGGIQPNDNFKEDLDGNLHNAMYILSYIKFDDINNATDAT